MQRVAIRPEIAERVVARRGKLHLFEKLDAKRTALLVIDMQNAFVAPGSPIEVPAAREIVAPINRLAAALRHVESRSSPSRRRRSGRARSVGASRARARGPRIRRARSSTRGIPCT